MSSVKGGARRRAGQDVGVAWTEYFSFMARA
jgi:hypothetical protein